MKINEILNEQIRPHGTPDNEFRMMLVGEKPAWLTHDYKNIKLIAPFIKQLGWHVLKFNLNDSGFKIPSYIITIKGEEWRADKIKSLMTDLHVNPKKYLNMDNYHKQFGKLLGYNDADIEFFIDGLHEKERKAKQDNAKCSESAYIKESTDASSEIDSSGLVAPDGTFYPCKYGYHDILGKEILKNLGIRNYVHGPLYECISRGFIRIEKEGSDTMGISVYNLAKSRSLVGDIIRRFPMYIEKIIVDDYTNWRNHNYTKRDYKIYTMHEAEKAFK